MTASRVLHLDIEGGFGGSSRSLFYFVENLDRARFASTVWCKRAGPIIEKYREAGIDHKAEPEIFSAIPLIRNNIKNWVALAPRLPHLRRMTERIKAFDPDLIHLNYEGLIPQAVLLRRAGITAPIVLHFRHMVAENRLSELYAKWAAETVDHVVFISENEVERWLGRHESLTRLPRAVIYNPAPRDLLDKPLTDKNREGPLRIGFFGKLHQFRAPWRLIELAERFQARRTRAYIDVYGGPGRTRQWGVLPYDQLGALRQAVREKGLDEWVTFHGHVNDPETRLQQADLVIRTSTEADPWGRDIIEALALGIPVLSHGTYGKFVVDGETGILLPEWDGERYADIIDRLAGDRTELGRMAENAKRHAQALFDPAERARMLMAVFEHALTKPNEARAA